MTYNKGVSLEQLAEAMIEAVEVGMVTGFSNSKGIVNKSVEDWVTDYIRSNYNEDFAKDINENL